MPGVAGRERVVAVAVLVPDLAVTAMDDHIGTLIPGDLPGDVDRLLLGADDLARPLAAIALDGPLAALRHHMLVLRHARPPRKNRHQIIGMEAIGMEAVTPRMGDYRR